MNEIQWVKPLTPSDIPAGCYAVWDEVNEVWTFPTLLSLNPSKEPENPPIVDNPTV